MEALISVIVPIYNSEKALEKCLNSLKTQSYKNLQVLLIDDGSTDTSAQICNKFCVEDNRFEYVYQENAGVSAARNKGLSLARGEYIGFCDSDDWVDETTYEKMLSLLLNEGADVAITDFAFEKDGKLRAFVDDDTVFVYDNKSAIKEMHSGEKFGGELCNKLFKKELFDGESLPRDIAIYEDMVLTWNLFYKSKKIVFQDLHLYRYVLWGGSATHTFREKMWTVQQAGEIMLKRVQEKLPELTAYAKKTLLNGDLLIANTMYNSNVFSRENYKKIKVHYKKYYNKETLKLLKRYTKIEAKAFMGGYGLFVFYKWLSKLKLLRKLLKKS